MHVSYATVKACFSSEGMSIYVTFRDLTNILPVVVHLPYCKIHEINTILEVSHSNTVWLGYIQQLYTT